MPTPLTITTCSFCSASGFEAQCARGQVRQIHCAAVLGRSLAEPWNVMMESTCETYAVPCCALSANSDVFGCSSLTVLTVLFCLRIFWGAPCLTKKMVDYGYDWHWLTNYDWLIMSGCFFSTAVSPQIGPRIGGYKFHMRIHLVITNMSPLEAWNRNLEGWEM